MKERERGILRRRKKEGLVSHGKIFTPLVLVIGRKKCSLNFFKGFPCARKKLFSAFTSSFWGKHKSAWEGDRADKNFKKRKTAVELPPPAINYKHLHFWEKTARHKDFKFGKSGRCRERKSAQKFYSAGKNLNCLLRCIFSSPQAKKGLFFPGIECFSLPAARQLILDGLTQSPPFLPGAAKRASYCSFQVRFSSIGAMPRFFSLVSKRGKESYSHFSGSFFSIYLNRPFLPSFLLGH